MRSLLRVFTAYFRNAPTLYKLHELLAAEASEESNNTEAQRHLKKGEEISSFASLSYYLGLVQILEEYCKCSLAGQGIVTFPTSVAQSFQHFLDKLVVWGDEWEWEEQPLKLAGIGSCADILQDMKSGTYAPRVTKSQFMRLVIIVS